MPIPSKTPLSAERRTQLLEELTVWRDMVKDCMDFIDAHVDAVRDLPPEKLTPEALDEIVTSIEKKLGTLGE